MRVEISGSQEFIPAWRGNRDDDTPVVVVVRQPTAREFRTLNARQLSHRTDAGSAAVTLGIDPADMDRTLSLLVTELRHLEVLTPGGETRGITTVKALLDTPELGGLADEIYRYIGREMLGRPGLDPPSSEDSGSSSATAD